MKKLILALFMVVGAFAVQAQNEVTQVANPNAPEVSFDKLVHDYGTIVQNGDGNCVFEFTNTGREPLILTNVRSSCGCTVPTWPRKPILPGKKETIAVKYATNRLGIINKSITVMSNAKNNPVVLRIKGKVVKSDDNTPKNTLEQNTGAPVAGTH